MNVEESTLFYTNSNNATPLGNHIQHSMKNYNRVWQFPQTSERSKVFTCVFALL